MDSMVVSKFPIDVSAAASAGVASTIISGDWITALPAAVAVAGAAAWYVVPANLWDEVDDGKLKGNGAAAAVAMDVVVCG